MKNNKIFNCVLAITFSCSAFVTFTQGDPNFRQNQFNILMLNPAQAGANSYSEISALAVNQWVGIPGAPKTYTASGNFKVMDNFGVGVALLGDQYGPVNLTRSDINLAYHLKLSENWKFGLGIRMSISNTAVNLTELNTIVDNDPYMQSNLRTGLAFNAGFGGLLYSKKFYAGFAMPQLAKTNFLNSNMTNFVDTRKGFIAYVGGCFKLNNRLDLRPNVVSRYVSGTPFNLDVNTILSFNKNFDFGVTYQWQSGLGAIVGYDIKQKFYVGYSFSYPVNQLNRVTTQTHELALRFRFPQKSNRSQSPRFFI